MRWGLCGLAALLLASCFDSSAQQVAQFNDPSECSSSGGCGGELVCRDGDASQDCAGVCGGTAVVDDCGICEGGNASQDCAGTCGGAALVDSCGICDADPSNDNDCDPSCDGAGLDCDDDGVAVSCCDATVVEGGTFPMGRCGYVGTGCSDEYGSSLLAEETPEHDVTVSSFVLDTFEVTVGRFRAFVSAYDGGWRPAVGEGAHPLIAGTGWQSKWDTDERLPTDGADLRTVLLEGCGNSPTWADTPGAGEQYPINCVSWYVAFAFCAWDGGRLATEAEWEYAAAGGAENRLYPWGPEAPGALPYRANHAGAGNSPFIDVGSYPDGVSRWGQHDLGGSMWEWTLDWFDSGWYAGGGAMCNDCTNDMPASPRVIRGGFWNNPATVLRAASRGILTPSVGIVNIGVRCARTSL